MKGINMIFQEKDGALKELKNIEFALEKDLQRFVEKNMNAVINYKFVATEFAVDNYRFDSVAFDEENSAFVIVEYKKGKSESLVDQGYAYLKTVFDRKADFVLLYNEKFNASKKVNNFDWSQTRIVFVSPKFTQYQIDATSFGDMPFELIEVKCYEYGLYEIERIDKGKPPVKKIPSKSLESDTIKQVNEEIRLYDEDYHLNKAKGEAKDLYLELKDRLLDMNYDFTVVCRKNYIAFKKNRTKNVIDIWLKKDWLEVVFALKQGELFDSENLTYDISNRLWSSEQYAMRVDKKTDMNYVLELVRQVYMKK